MSNETFCSLELDSTAIELSRFDDVMVFNWYPITGSLIT
jgi:hypothetical protein